MLAAWVLAPLIMAAFAPAQDGRAERERTRAAQRFEQAARARDAADAALVADYQACEDWVRGADHALGEPPATLQSYWTARGVGALDWAKQRPVLAAEPFHELWNRELYLLSAAAKDYARAVEELEEAFLAQEKLRHPERFQKGFAETPAGMTLIPGGRYTLGPNTGYLLGHAKFQEPRTVRLDAYYLDRREVTCAEYARFLLSQPRGLREQHLPLAWGLDADGAPLFPEGAAALPVAGVSWSSAARYAQWAGKRLPTEDEWEAAAAGLERRRYPTGGEFSSSKVNCRASGRRQPRPAGDYPEDATPQGVQSLSGNVREWTADLYDEKPGRDQANPVRTPGPYTNAVVRGGSFEDEPEACTSAFRWLEPALGTRLPNVGFRCAANVR